MKNSFLSHIKHPIFLGGIAVVLIISGISFMYYRAIEQPPQYSYVKAKTGTVIETVTETGVVKAASEVDLGFQSSGQIAHVYTTVGAEVGSGQILASLTNADVAAQLATAQANAQAAQAKLDSLKHGTRPEQLAIYQTAVDQANLSLSNSYSGAVTTIQNDYISANDAVRKQMNAFFNNAEQFDLSLTFITSDSQEKINAESARAAIGVELKTWKEAIAPIGLGSDSTTLDRAITDAETHLLNVQKFLSIMNDALTHQVNISATNLPAYQTSITTAQLEISASLSATINLKKELSSEAIAVKQANNNLDLAKAGATADDIAVQNAAVAAAQATVLNAQAQFEKTIIRSPITGVVTKSDAKIGANVSPNVPIISLISKGKFQVETYLSEADVSAIQVGNQATITLDAYGTDTPFSATVISVDSSQTVVAGAPTYKAVLQFTNNDPRLKADLTANVNIVTATHENVVEVPTSAIIRRGTDRFVLINTGASKPEERQVQIGIHGTDGMDEILSGVTTGDQVVNFGNDSAL
jgi:HlyD family secretion protein